MSAPLVPVILKIYLSNSSDTVSEVPITPETTCRDVIECCREPGEEQCHLAELWRGCERPIGDEEKPYEILQQWGIHREEVKFFLRHENAVPLGNVNSGRRNKKRHSAKEYDDDTEELKVRLQFVIRTPSRTCEIVAEILIRILIRIWPRVLVL